MKGHPEYEGWTEALGRLAASPEMEPFRGVLNALADNALSTEQPLNEFLDKQAAATPFEAVDSAIQRSAAEPCAPAAFLATFVCVRTWIRAAGGEIYNQDPTGRPSRAWTLFPQALVSAAMRVGAWRPALEIAEEAYDVLFGSKYSSWQPIATAMERSRELAHQCSMAFERCVRDLADDLRERCDPAGPNVRAEFGAMLWTLGLVPQSLNFVADPGGADLPGRRLARHVVRHSMYRMRHDRLLQYVWLELKKNPALQIRAHEEIFAIINNRFGADQLYFTMEMVIGDEPGRLYAQALAGWFRGTLGSEEKDNYIRLVGQLSQLTTGHEDLLHTLPRMFYLALFLGRRCGWPEGFNEDESEDLRLLRGWVEQSALQRRNLALYPALPDPQTALSVPLYELIEAELGSIGCQADSEGARRAWEVLESYRGSALEYWMIVTAPIAPVRKRHAVEDGGESSVADRMLSEEEQLLAWLRGAYFLILSDTLPAHFQRYATEPNAFWAQQAMGPVLDPEQGRKEYLEIRKRLKNLYGRMGEVFPDYASQRTQTHAQWADVVHAVHQHSATAGTKTASD